LPALHLEALSKIKMGPCNKVMIRFKEKWWPKLPEGCNLIRWYGPLLGCKQSGSGMREKGREVDEKENEYGEASGEGDGEDEGEGNNFNRLLNGFSFIDWLDMSDACGEPVLVGFICGKSSIDKFMKNKSDKEVVDSAVNELRMWAASYLQNS